MEGESIAGTVAAVWMVFFVFAPAGAAQYIIWPVVPLLIDRPRLGIVYLLAATPFMFLFYPFAFVSVLPFDAYSLLANVWSWVKVDDSWAWPALGLWGVLVIMLIYEAPRWWRTSPPGNGFREALPAADELKPMVGASIV
jgi:hypothetical protein